MATFDDVIGYGAKKETLRGICDVLKNPARYARLGAKAPSGMILYGPPGVGKTLMASAMLEEAGRPHVILRRDSFDSDLMVKIKRAFSEAESLAPSVILLDDLDKFTEFTGRYRDAKELIAVQALIDGLRADVFTIATVNDMGKIPASLLRPGRLEVHVALGYPKFSDAKEIIAHYLEGKKISKDVDAGEIAAIMWRSSCASLESALNEAAIFSAHEGLEEISRENLIKTLLFHLYGVDLERDDEDEKSREGTAYYVGGVVAAYNAIYKDTLAFASICHGRRMDGARGCVEFGREAAKNFAFEDIQKKMVIRLAGRAAFEKKYGYLPERSGGDIASAMHEMEMCVIDKGVSGLRFPLCPVLRHEYLTSEASRARRTDAVSSIVEKAAVEAERLVREKWDDVEKTAVKLLERRYLTGSEIHSILN